MLKNKLEDEKLDPCFICDKIWTRKETDKYFYFNSITVCQEHAEAIVWYNASVKMADARFRYIMSFTK